jgi:hypothetical protein
MNIAAKVLSLMGGIHRADIEALTPLELQRFAQYCRHFGQLAEQACQGKAGARAGVLRDLKDGNRE